MKTLILKNWLTLRKGNPLFLAFLVMYTIIGACASNTVFYGCFVAFICALTPKTVMAFDERCGWERYAAVLPLSRKTYVQSFYVLSLLISLAGTALFCGLHAVLSMNSERFPNAIPMPIVIALMLSFALLMGAFNYPFIFKLGLERGRASMMIAAVIAMALGIVAFGALEIYRVFTLSPAIYGLGVVISALIWIASLFLSIRLYQSRDL